MKNFYCLIVLLTSCFLLRGDSAFVRKLDSNQELKGLIKNVVKEQYTEDELLAIYYELKRAYAILEQDADALHDDIAGTPFKKVPWMVYRAYRYDLPTLLRKPKFNAVTELVKFAEQQRVKINIEFKEKTGWSLGTLAVFSLPSTYKKLKPALQQALSYMIAVQAKVIYIPLYLILARHKPELLQFTYDKTKCFPKPCKNKDNVLILPDLYEYPLHSCTVQKPLDHITECGTGHATVVLDKYYEQDPKLYQLIDNVQKHGPYSQEDLDDIEAVLHETYNILHITDSDIRNLGVQQSALTLTLSKLKEIAHAFYYHGWSTYHKRSSTFLSLHELIGYKDDKMQQIKNEFHKKTGYHLDMYTAWRAQEHAKIQQAFTSALQEYRELLTHTLYFPLYQILAKKFPEKLSLQTNRTKCLPKPCKTKNHQLILPDLVKFPSGSCQEDPVDDIVTCTAKQAD